MRIIAKTLAGLEEVLAEEVQEITGKEVELLKRAIAFEGTLEDLYKINYQCRCLLRALVEIATKTIPEDVEALYKFVYDIDWSQYFDLDKTFAIDAVVYSEFFHHDGFVALKSKDGIVDSFRDKTGLRPDVNVKNPDVAINVHINKGNKVTISLDSSGESLHKRGYRKEQNDAPISEVLAAGIIKISGWDKVHCLYDPMCGSGTFPIEAHMAAAKIPARYLKPTFGFQKWKDFDFELWLKVKQKADVQIGPPMAEILGSDISGEAVGMAKNNSKPLPFSDMISFKTSDFLEKGGPRKARRIFINPPYDRRMAFLDIESFYKAIGDKLKQDYQASEAWIITGNMSAMKKFGLRAARKIPVFNGPMECKLYKYVLYEGSKKRKYLENKE